ncbi:MAG: hypothetical protein IKQ52_11735, partial [Bacteroidales bacterium]|nr:hypothetical protein [Bacteroidales bacterium]
MATSITDASSTGKKILFIFIAFNVVEKSAANLRILCELTKNANLNLSTDLFFITSVPPKTFPPWEHIIPTVGTYHSHRGNGGFPRWECFGGLRICFSR